jgi:hypothetical protein
MTDEDADFDEYNDASFDEAFADLIESLKDAENGTKAVIHTTYLCRTQVRSNGRCFRDTRFRT